MQTFEVEGLVVCSITSLSMAQFSLNKSQMIQCASKNLLAALSSKIEPLAKGPERCRLFLFIEKAWNFD
jgi:hypothetical protein